MRNVLAVSGRSLHVIDGDGAGHLAEMDRAVAKN